MAINVQVEMNAMNPDRKNHSIAHKKFIASIHEFNKRLVDDHKLKNHEVFDFLRTWLLKHISRTDQELGAFIKEKRERAVEQAAA